MKQTVVVALAVSLAGVCAKPFQYGTAEIRALIHRALMKRSFLGGDSTTNVHGGTGGAGSKSWGGRGGRGETATGSRGGKQSNRGANTGTFGDVTTNMENAQTGMIGGNSGQNSISGKVTNNAGAPFQFGGGMFDKALNFRHDYQY